MRPRQGAAACGVQSGAAQSRPASSGIRRRRPRRSRNQAGAVARGGATSRLWQDLLYHLLQRLRPRRPLVASWALASASTSTQNKNTPHLPATPLLIGRSRLSLDAREGGGRAAAGPPLPQEQPLRSPRAVGAEPLLRPAPSRTKAAVPGRRRAGKRRVDGCGAGQVCVLRTRETGRSAAGASPPRGPVANQPTRSRPRRPPGLSFALCTPSWDSHPPDNPTSAPVTHGRLKAEVQQAIPARSHFPPLSGRLGMGTALPLMSPPH